MLWTFYPGFMSFDSAYSWHMVRTGQWHDIHPPWMLIVWSFTERVLPGPGGVLVLHLVLFWAGLVVLVRALFPDGKQQIAAVLVLGFWPALVALLPFIWKDVGLLVAMVWLLALLACERHRPKRWLRLLALLVLAIACAYRYNALPLAVPFVWYLADREWPDVARWRRVGLSAGFLLGVALLSRLPSLLPGIEHRDLWPVGALWDIAAVSVAENRLLFPPELVDPSLTVDELKTHFVAYNNVPILNTGKIRDNISAAEYTASERAALDSAWLRLWYEHPSAMLHHRLRLSGLLFGFSPAALPDNQVFQPARVPLADNPRIEPREPAMQRWWTRLTASLVDTPIFAMWFYVLLGLSSLVGRERARVDPLQATVLLSGLFYLLPLPLVSPSAEFRYLSWPVFAALAALVLRSTPLGNMPGVPSREVRPDSGVT